MSRESRLDREGIEIAYWVYGEGTPLLLITGLATPAAAWGPFPQMLADQGFQVLVVDNRDCGKSSRCNDEYTINEMAMDAAGVLAQEGIDRSHVFGISMGGFIAQELALDRPDLVSRLMLVSTGPGVGGGVAPDEDFLAKLLGVDLLDPQKAAKQVVRLLVAPDFANDNEWLLEAAAQFRAEGAAELDAFARQWQAIGNFSSWDRLPGLKVPTLIMHGDSDELVPVQNGINLASRIPDASLMIIEGCGHLLPLEAPFDVLSAVINFFPATQEAV